MDQEVTRSRETGRNIVNKCKGDISPTTISPNAGRPDRHHVEEKRLIIASLAVAPIPGN
jgi:hypothetical protein